jgi:hypothetical protein
MQGTRGASRHPATLALMSRKEPRIGEAECAAHETSSRRTEARHAEYEPLPLLERVSSRSESSLAPPAHPIRLPGTSDDCDCLPMGKLFHGHSTGVIDGVADRCMVQGTRQMAAGLRPWHGICKNHYPRDWQNPSVVDWVLLLTQLRLEIHYFRASL